MELLWKYCAHISSIKYPAYYLKEIHGHDIRLLLHKSILYDEIKLGTSYLRQGTKHPQIPYIKICIVTVF